MKIITEFNTLLYLHMICQHVIELIMLETTHNQYELTPTNIFVHK